MDGPPSVLQRAGLGPQVFVDRDRRRLPEPSDLLCHHLLNRVGFVIKPCAPTLYGTLALCHVIRQIDHPPDTLQEVVEIARLQEPSLDGKFTNEPFHIAYRDFFFGHERFDALGPPFPRPFGSCDPDKPTHSKEAATDHSSKANKAEGQGNCVVQRHRGINSYRRKCQQPSNQHSDTRPNKTVLSGGIVTGTVPFDNDSLLQ